LSPLQLSLAMNTRNKISSVLFVGLLLTRASACAQGAFHVFGPPEGESNLDGNSSFTPFATSASGRFQQIYSSSSLSPVIPPGGVYIVEIAFRVDASAVGILDVIVPNVQLNFSTTQRSPDALSTIFSENIGADDKVVIGPSSMRLVGASPGFNVFLDFRDTPFYYNPANGNLLMDFRIFTGAGNPPSGGPPLDAFNVARDSVSSVSAFGGTLPSSGSASSLGLATAFFVTSVPEPSSWALLITAAACFGLWRKKKADERRNDVPH